jgi:hypothetical protein
VPASPATIIVTLLPSKRSRVVMIAFILFTPLKQSQPICGEVRTVCGMSPKRPAIWLLVPSIRLEGARLVQPELAVSTHETVRFDARSRLRGRPGTARDNSPAKRLTFATGRFGRYSFVLATLAWRDRLGMLSRAIMSRSI